VSTNASKRLKSVKGSTFEVDLEYSKDYLILHLPYIDKFTKSVYFEMLCMLDDWWDFFRTVGYKEIHAAVDSNNTRINKLLRKLNFRLIGSSKNMNIWSYRGD
jgi:hypothetical protein